ncbi:unnamed protein product [Blepharisma stoltei]|uniref:non-specific serine/threonine protein kinase n=1 Tax=Blepharisma stoltei TaxID=1481888 RepID=A0AAU9JK76_9CILI|nr:unnamed protein product [Blepharisma stoltei]
MGVCLRKQNTVKEENTLLCLNEGLSSTIRNVPIRSIYKLGRILGTGHFGVVKEVQVIGSEEKAAIKFILKDLVEDRINSLKQEIEILKRVDHPNIIRFFEAYEDERYIYLAMELCTGGDLLRLMTKNDHIDENKSKIILRQMLLAINHLHNNNIIHRDLKPENFLFESEDDNAALKLVDFGLSSKFRNRRMSMHKAVGTVYYLAPEMIKGAYNFKCDMWSIGVIMFVMLSGKLPFWSKFDCETCHQILNGAPEFIEPIWENISQEAKNLLSHLLCMNPSDRFSASEALDHPWFNSQPKPRIVMNQFTIDALKEYSKISAFKKEAMNILVKYLSLNEIKSMNALFSDLDEENNGSISMKLLLNSLKNAGSSIAARNEIKEIIKSLDLDKNGKINYSEFLAATYYSKHHIQQEELWLTFLHFDADRKGYITRIDIERAFSRSGHALKEQDIKNIMKEFGKEPGAKIGYDEFERLLKM